MQGLGKPGINQIASPWMHWPRPAVNLGAWVAEGGAWTGIDPNFMTRQFIPKTLVHEAILNPPITTSGSGVLIYPHRGPIY